MEGLSEYEESLNAIFEKIKKSGAEVIFLTQNYMCTKVSPHLTDESMKELAKKFSSRQSSGILDLYYDKAKELCRKHNVEVCDLYAVWKAMDKSGVDVTELLANKLNHPIREYHYYIAIKLIEKILGV